MTKVRSRTRRPRAWSISIPASMLLFATGCAPQRAPEVRGTTDGVGAVVATYSGGAIGTAELEAWRRSHAKLAASGPATLVEAEQIALAWRLADAAEARGAAEDPAIRYRLRFDTDRVLGQALRQSVAATVEVGDAAVLAARDAHPDAFRKPAKIRLRHLYKRFPPDADEATRNTLRAEARRLRDQAVAGSDFATLARESSDSQTRFRDGLIGNVAAGDLPPAVEAIIWDLEAGEVSEVHETADGASVFFVESVLESVEPTEEEVLERLRANLEREAHKDAWAAVEAAVLERSAPEFEVARPEGEAASAVWVRWDGGTITRNEVDAWVARTDRTVEDLARPALRRQVQSLVLGRLIGDEALARGLGDDPEVRDRLHWLRLDALAIDELRRLVAERFQEPSEEAVRAYHEAHHESFKVPPSFDLRAISLPVTPEDAAGAHARAHALRARVVRGELTFDAAARAHSNHPSADSGGKLGWVQGPRLAGFGANVWKTVNALEAGAVSEVVEQDGTLWILRLDAVEPRRFATFDEARDRALTRVANQALGALQGEIELEIVGSLAVELMAP